MINFPDDFVKIFLRINVLYVDGLVSYTNQVNLDY